jgi:hypothetical protein
MIPYMTLKTFPFRVWFDWKDPNKLWVGLGNPCSEEDMNIFYAATTITLGNGKKTPFWDAPWLNGRAPKEIAPKIFESSKRKKCKVEQAIVNRYWIASITIDNTFSETHLAQFIELWQLVNGVQLQSGVEDSVVWKLTANGQYSAASAYNLQFLGLVQSAMNTIVWKAWATPKAKHHAWLAFQNRLWTADRLEKRGWANCGLCPFCKQTTESTDHLFVHCRFTVRLWELLIGWLGLQGIHPRAWATLSIKEWWTLLADGITPHRKALATLTMLTVWEIWNERNARVFRNKQSPSFVIFHRIKTEERLWVLAGAKKLGNIMPGE